MMRRSTAWLPRGILPVLAATSFWLNGVVEGSGVPGRTRSHHDADLIVTGFSVHQLDPAGHTRYTLAARQMLHFSDDDATSYEGVALTAFEPGLPPLNINAEHAVRAARQDQVVFTGSVRAERAAASPGEPPMVLTTSRLEVYPERRQGQAPSSLVVTHGADRLEADTMSFDFKLSTVRFTRAKASFLSLSR